MTRLSIVLAAAIAAASFPALATAQQPRVAITGSAGIPVRADGLVGAWFPPASGKRGPAILVLGGSDGGEAGSRRIGQAFAEQGYGVLALAWFKAPGLPDQLQDVPLEYFDKAIDWLNAQPLVDPKHLGLYGVSKGGEAALLVVSRRPDM